MTEEDLIRAHCLAEVQARRRWAEDVTDAWRVRASVISLEMLDDALALSIDEQVENMFSYWKLRCEGQQAGRYIDMSARRQWDAVVDGNPVEGNYSYWQMAHPAPGAEPATRI
jgi:hypothetical protein